jgi:hypothetical protein
MRIFWVSLVLSGFMMISCSKQSTNNSGTVITGNNTFAVGYGIDFSTNTVYNIAFDSTNRKERTDLVDFYICIAGTDSIGIVYDLWGSPVLYNNNIDADVPSITPIGNITFDEITNLPDDGSFLKKWRVWNSIYPGSLFAIRTQELKYAFFEVTNFSNGVISIKWKFQSNGKNEF